MSEKIKVGTTFKESESIDDALARVRGEKNKLDFYGEKGQLVKIINRSISPEGELSGEIVDVQISGSFAEEDLVEWSNQISPDYTHLPTSSVKARVIGGKRDSEVIDNLSISEWEPVKE